MRETEQEQGEREEDERAGAERQRRAAERGRDYKSLGERCDFSLGSLIHVCVACYDVCTTVGGKGGG